MKTAILGFLLAFNLVSGTIVIPVSATGTGHGWRARDECRLAGFAPKRVFELECPYFNTFRPSNSRFLFPAQSSISNKREHNP
jgi:hypothetical protein